MFRSKTEKIAEISTESAELIQKLDDLLSGRTMMYIDYANIKPWSNKLKFHIDIKRLKQFLDSFLQIERVHLYQGTLIGDSNSENVVKEIFNRKYILHTKPVKLINQSVDVNSLPSMHSSDLLRGLIKESLLKTFTIDQIQDLNKHLLSLNQSGVSTLQSRKCNFDVEIGMEILLDPQSDNVDTFVLWTGDSDFVSPIMKLLDSNKNVILFATAGRIASELNSLKNHGLKIFDIKDIRNFICWPREMVKTEFNK